MHSVAGVRTALGLHARAAEDHARVAALREGELGAADPRVLDARRLQARALLMAGDVAGARAVIDAAQGLAAALALAMAAIRAQKDAAGASFEREDMSGAHAIARGRPRIDRRTDGMRSIGG